MAHALEFHDVVKTYPGFTLGPLDFDLEPGRVLGYVGPNGAGKTTTMHCLVGLVRPARGEIRVFGRLTDPDRPDWKRDVGYVGEEHAFAEEATGDENLAFLRPYYPRWSDAHARDLAARFRLRLDRPARQLSRGDRVKLSLVTALAHAPRLLVLDEPTAGLDPVVRAELLDVLFETVGDGEHAILYSTHVLTDIVRLADELAFLDGGRIKLRVAKDDLLDQWRRISFRLPQNEVSLRGIVSHRHEGRDHEVVSHDRLVTLAHLGELGAERVIEHPMTVDDIAVQILRG